MPPSVKFLVAWLKEIRLFYVRIRMDKKELAAKGIMRSIEQILLHDWDPIGISNVPEAQDEYSSYVGGVYRLLASNASSERIAEHLAKIEDEQMGLGKRKISDLTSIAKRLLSLDVRLPK